MNRRDALLLLGPTGSGKTPLGDLLEQQGMGSCKMVHLDFGERIRAAVSGRLPNVMNDDDMLFLKSIVEKGALLENETFYLAEKIIEHFLDEAGPDVDFVVLNGLPRHVGQAEDVSRWFNVKTVVHLCCTPAVTRARIMTDSGGDRGLREDDSIELVERKLKIFKDRTFPLLAYYKKRCANLIDMDVEVDTSPMQIQKMVSEIF